MTKVKKYCSKDELEKIVKQINDLNALQKAQKLIKELEQPEMPVLEDKYRYASQQGLDGWLVRNFAGYNDPAMNPNIGQYLYESRYINENKVTEVNQFINEYLNALSHLLQEYIKYREQCREYDEKIMELKDKEAKLKESLGIR